MYREAIDTPEELPQIERISVVPGWADDDSQEIPEEWDDQSADYEAKRKLYLEAQRRTRESIEEAIRHVRKISSGTIVGPARRDDE